ncbi:MAG: DEAD/DEAH box helicase family protein [bacterium]
MLHESEWQTRKERIDRKLTSLAPAWKIIPYRDDLELSALTHHAVTEFQTDNGPADYALFVNGKILGIIEAKKVKIGPQNVLEQAKRYAKGVRAGVGNWNGYRVPFLYSTNGEIIWFLDARNKKNLSRQISNFHTHSALKEFFDRPDTDYLPTPVENEKLRAYQIRAIQKTEEALAKGKRAMLIAMATGTGKTFLTVSQIYRLLESKRFKRILFLADRRALAAQAVREFATFTTPKGNKFNQEYEVYSQRPRL